MWQPIATAPADGSPVILGHGLSDPWTGEWIIDTTSSHTLCIAHYSDGEWRTFCCHPDSCPVFMTPTHWMPLPDACITVKPL